MRRKCHKHSVMERAVEAVDLDHVSLTLRRSWIIPICQAGAQYKLYRVLVFEAFTQDITGGSLPASPLSIKDEQELESHPEHPEHNRAWMLHIASL